jgi:hypothetical protein
MRCRLVLLASHLKQPVESLFSDIPPGFAEGIGRPEVTPDQLVVPEGHFFFDR